MYYANLANLLSMIKDKQMFIRPQPTSQMIFITSADRDFIAADSENIVSHGFLSFFIS